MYHLHDSHFKYSDINRLKVKEQKKIYHASINQRKAEVAILISDKVDFKARKFTGQKGTLHNDEKVNLSRRHSIPMGFPGGTVVKNLPANTGDTD